MIHREEPAYIPMELDRDSHNFFTLHGYEYIMNHKLPLMIKSLDPSAQVVNIFETREARQVLDTLRRYYKEGFINEDAESPEDLNAGPKCSGNLQAAVRSRRRLGVRIAATRL